MIESTILQLFFQKFSFIYQLHPINVKGLDCHDSCFKIQLCVPSCVKYYFNLAWCTSLALGSIQFAIYVSIVTVNCDPIKI